MKRVSVVIASIAAATSAMAAAQSIMPGKWRMTSIARALDMPGMPPQMLAMMRRPTTISYCITPDKARLGPQSLLKGNRDCRFSRFDVHGNRIDMTMLCKQRDGTMTVTGSGSFTATSFVTDGRSTMSGPHGMTITSHSEGHRIGPCGK